ncbi:hypothetical protein PCCS19_07790 [Paenibacillus sp. CCS19]|uniref:CPBP family intramembrane glutamic endopeptidase n=1 Tax=Paenibacillus sp. CCS19 TaxID=3158387 RepID=UPI00256175C5|nr:type II CAAX endopeptidase family protein [Paenibacillus cellulosilyticus]GMK37725.1 hypothetical protein PCCS19_07790 [Paenibacillus cellulosilyticus]
MRNAYSNKPSPVIAILVFYLVTSVGAMLFGLLQPSLDVPEVVIQLTQFGPTLGVAAVLFLWRHKKQPPFKLDLRLWPLQSNRITISAALIVITFAGAWLWFSVTGHAAAYTPPSALSHPFWLIVIAQFIGAAGEEIGWRCFLQPTLQNRIGVLPASIVVGILWGIWHVGVFSEGIAYASFFILFAVSLSVILGELMRNTRSGTLLLAAAYHALINLGLLLWFNEEDGSRLAMGTLSIACTIAAIIAVVVGRIARSKKRCTSTNETSSI